MGEQTDGRPAERGKRFTDRGARFTRRRFLTKAGIAAVAVGTGLLVAGCQFDDGAYQGKNVNQGSSTGQSSTSGQNATPSQNSSTGNANSGQGSSGSQSAMSS
ncbi:MAG TPA: twin-arginine translocation signal domain-containing protein [Trebonia sp.]|jgi:hypothetical protein|nr:twin-arginine translocation signal domain-containing protein [Trebonia sp.]